MRLWPFLLLFTTAAAQTPASSSNHAESATGVVTGHVYCSDTNEPARLATVMLEPVPPDPKPPTASGAAAAKSTAERTGTVMTALDGSYSIGDVHPGAYYVIVEERGYVNARNLFTTAQFEKPTPEIRYELAQKLTRVVVVPNQTEVADISLDRGASVSGMVLYDDGSPAGGITVALLTKDKDGRWVELPPGLSGNAPLQADDRGYYRIASLVAGEYMLKATLQLVDSRMVVAKFGGNQIQFDKQTFRSTLPFFGTGTPRIEEATSIKLGAGQARTGQDMTLPIAKLHKLSGRVLAGADSHPVNAATVAVVDRDSHKELASADLSREDGLFHFEFLPDGDYILRISNARDVTWDAAPSKGADSGNPFGSPEKERVLAKYGDADQPLLLTGDMFGVNAVVPPAPLE